MEISDDDLMAMMDAAEGSGQISEARRDSAARTINRFVANARRARHARAARRALFPAARRQVNYERGVRIARRAFDRGRRPARMRDIFIEGRRPENAYLFDPSSRVGEGFISASSPLAAVYRDPTNWSGKDTRARRDINIINSAIDWNRNPSIVASTFLQRWARPRVARMMYARRPHRYYKYA